jgi:hypothetical protein
MEAAADSVEEEADSVEAAAECVVEAEECAEAEAAGGVSRTRSEKRN